MDKMKLAVLFSGGKDSCLALHKVLAGGHEIAYLLNIVPETLDSFMFHKPYMALLERQAEELGIDLVVVGSAGEKEKELDDLVKLIESVKEDVDGIVVGGIASSYQGNRVKKICDDFGLEFVAPLWDYEPERLWEELIVAGFEVIMTKVSCDGLGKEWLGRVIDGGALEELRKLADKYKFRLDFEGGEAETSVLYMPGFDNRIEIDFDVESEGEYRHWMKDVVVRRSAYPKLRSEGAK
jgi:diphthine-ammonia ligase